MTGEVHISSDSCDLIMQVKALKNCSLELFRPHYVQAGLVLYWWQSLAVIATSSVSVNHHW